jgi:hypothetical protein
MARRPKRTKRETPHHFGQGGMAGLECGGAGRSGAGLPASLHWALKFLPHYFTDEAAPFHAELMGDLEDESRRLIARVAPRGHAKSTCAALAYPLWCICEQKRTNIVIVTHESSLATQFVRDIRHELESNERILCKYGDLCVGAASKPRSDGGTKGKNVRSEPRTPVRGQRVTRPKWSEHKFATATGVTVHARATGSSLRGTRSGPHRPELIICDDIEKDEHVESPQRRRRLEHWLRRVVMPALAPGGRLIVLGSLIHYDSLLANLRDPQRFPRWDYRVYRALEFRRLGVAGAEQQYEPVALWPARWPVERLHEERSRIGTLAFEQEYQANPIDDSLRVFRPEWLRRTDPDELVPQRLVTLMAVDPATGASGGDFFAVWVGSVDTSTGVIYTRELSLERVGIVGQVQRIMRTFEQWRPVRIGIEAVAYQVALHDILAEIGRRERLYLPVVPLRTIANKRARIEGIAPFFENGTFRLPAALSPEAERQFLEFPKARHDDAPDVCAMGIELAREFRATGGAIEVIRASPNPFARRGGW